jgi:hypothetical protein
MVASGATATMKASITSMLTGSTVKGTASSTDPTIWRKQQAAGTPMKQARGPP